MRTPNRVTGLVVRDGKVLLIHRFRNDSEFWIFPGGTVEGAEGPDTSINRVMLDQTGCWLVSNLHLFDEFDEHAFTWHYYFCELSPGEMKFGGPEAEQQSPTNRFLLEWVDLDQLHNLNLYPLPQRLVEVIRTNTGSMGGMAHSEIRVDTILENRVESKTENRVGPIPATA